MSVTRMRVINSLVENALQHLISYQQSSAVDFTGIRRAYGCLGNAVQMASKEDHGEEITIDLFHDLWKEAFPNKTLAKLVNE